MKILIVIAVCALVFIPTSVLAAENLKSTKRIYQVSDEDMYIDRFTDRGNICYVAYENRPSDSMPSISCLKED